MLEMEETKTAHSSETMGRYNSGAQKAFVFKCAMLRRGDKQGQTPGT